MLRHVADLEAYACNAIGDIRVLLTNIERDPSRAAGGHIDEGLQAVDAFIAVHADYARDPVLHVDRWRSWLAHPGSRDLGTDHNAVLSTAVEDPASLRLEDHPRLLGALVSARKVKIRLRNPAVRPWDYADRPSYHAALLRHYQYLPHEAPKLRYYSVTDEEDERHLRSRLNGEMRAERHQPVTFWQSAVAPSQLEKLGTLPDQDSLIGRGAQICRTDAYYAGRGLVPGDMLADLRRARIVVTNYHAFKPRERLEISKGGR